ncbi:hypothetical protein NDU88_004488 [Pleurodeles waltl]|uniref:Uncharacterized protein n=1 Tax=Pleurodeles waltl TaxID=8319 RepID=A0AAV7LIQ7_PLEWA|nr:hypothetical protein NDU88_004488 [Pleurodeles waltl]
MFSAISGSAVEMRHCNQEYAAPLRTVQEMRTRIKRNPVKPAQSARYQKWKSVTKKGYPADLRTSAMLSSRSLLRNSSAHRA